MNLAQLVVPILNLCEQTAIACYDLVGKRDEYAADQAAVATMRHLLNDIDFSGKVVIGEGERDQAPMLYIGERVGKKFSNVHEVDIAVDPLEGTKLCAQGKDNAMSVIAIAAKGGFLHAPDVYMQKIAIGPCGDKNVINIEDSVTNNLIRLAKIRNSKISDLKVTILDRERHIKIIEEVKAVGANIKLISDGDVLAIINTALGNNKTDMYIGIGGAPEGVLAAAALQATGGTMQGKLIFNTDQEKDRACKLGLTDFNKVYNTDDLAKGDIWFCASGVTQGDLFDGVQINDDGTYSCHSLIMNSSSKAIRKVKSYISLTRVYLSRL